MRRAVFIYLAAGLACALYLCILFLNIPINTEARDYIFYHGYLANIEAWSNLFYPSGINQRIVSLLGFALSRDACGFHAPCINAIQIAELLGCFAIGTFHLHQLLRRPLIIAVCMLLWTLSPPVFMAGFWQATQHDKLAFLFALSALSLGLWAIRHTGMRGRLVASLGVSVLFVLAINAKEIAFFLPASAIAQIVLLTPEPGLRGRVKAASVYALPGAYAVLYITTYLWHLSGSWHQHVLSGDIATNSSYYVETLSGSRPAFEVVIAATIFLFSMSCFIWGRTGLHLLRPEAMPGHSNERSWSAITLYLAVIVLASLTLVLKAQYPTDYYLLLTEWAFMGWLGANIVLAMQSNAVSRYGMFAALSVMAAGFALGRYDAFARGGESTELIHEGRRVSAGYRVLTRYCGAPMQDGLKLVFPERPAGAVYFFRGGGEGNDPRLGSFICVDGPAPAMSYNFDGDARLTQPGQAVAVWDRGLKLRTIAKDGVFIYQKAK